jgi:8-oxo-dGTP pyrophosphatase MutT (NUDIX family)
MRLTAEELPFTPDLAFARALLARWQAPSLDQARTRDAMLAFIDAHPADAHLRTSLEGHLTASALVLDARGERALLTFHKKLGRWLQLGGHCDGDANLPGVALREAHEESGIEALTIDPVPIDVDIHPIPARPGEPAHVHLDTRFLLWAGPEAQARMSSESLDLAWFTPAEAGTLDSDDSVRRLFRIAFERA